ncbi:hypothetical protein ACQ4PT_007528 [Festuca glaucescens]
MNCRGCGQPELRLLVEQFRPDVVFLSETKMSAERSEKLRWTSGFDHVIGVDSMGLGGGLVLLWKIGNIVCLSSKDLSHIDVFISNGESNGKEWRFTGFYGEPKREKRAESWFLMRFLRSTPDLSWLCAGDFNGILSQEEQCGGNEREEWQMNGFRGAMEACGFMDLGFTGHPCHHVQTSESDHCALVLDIVHQPLQAQRGSKKDFRYENMWAWDPGYEAFIKEAWNPPSLGLKGVGDWLRKLQNSLQEWEKNCFGSVRGRLENSRTQLARIRERNMHSGTTKEEKELLKRISELMARGEVLLKQCSRVQWLALRVIAIRRSSTPNARPGPDRTEYRL